MNVRRSTSFPKTGMYWVTFRQVKDQSSGCKKHIIFYEKGRYLDTTAKPCHGTSEMVCSASKSRYHPNAITPTPMKTRTVRELAVTSYLDLPEVSSSYLTITLSRLAMPHILPHSHHGTMRSVNDPCKKSVLSYASGNKVNVRINSN